MQSSIWRRTHQLLYSVRGCLSRWVGGRIPLGLRRMNRCEGYGVEEALRKSLGCGRSWRRAEVRVGLSCSWSGKVQKEGGEKNKTEQRAVACPWGAYSCMYVYIHTQTYTHTHISELLWDITTLLVVTVGKRWWRFRSFGSVAPRSSLHPWPWSYPCAQVDSWGPCASDGGKLPSGFKELGWCHLGRVFRNSDRFSVL